MRRMRMAFVAGLALIAAGVGGAAAAGARAFGRGTRVGSLPAHARRSALP